MNRKQIVWAAVIFPLTAAVSLDRTVMAVAAPFVQKEFGFSLMEMSIIITSLFFTYSGLNWLSGVVVDRLGVRISLAAAALWWSVFTGLTPLGNSFAGLLVLRLLVGAGQAPDWPASLRSIVETFPKNEYGKGNSILLGGLYLGPIIGAPLTIWIITTLGWRSAFYIFAVAGGLLALVWYAVYRDNPRAIEEKRTVPVSWKAVAKSGRAWILGVQAFCYVVVMSFFVSWLPTYLLNSRGFSLRNVAYGATFPYIALFIMVFVAGKLQDVVYQRTGSAYLARVPFAIVGFLLSSSLLIAASLVTDASILIVCLTLSLGALGLVSVSIWSSCANMGGSSAGALTGWTNMWANLANALGPIFTAFITGLTGSWAMGIMVLGITGLLGAVLWLFVHPERPINIEV
ncbi:MAG: MFS transporter [Rhodopila sp.]|nr:MFS transporter [Rhodopila sp.]